MGQRVTPNPAIIIPFRIKQHLLTPPHSRRRRTPLHITDPQMLQTVHLQAVGGHGLHHPDACRRPTCGRARIALKTNLFYDATLTANIGAEVAVAPGGRSTSQATSTPGPSAPTSAGNTWMIQPEARFSVLRGHRRTLCRRPPPRRTIQLRRNPPPRLPRLQSQRAPPQPL